MTNRPLMMLDQETQPPEEKRHEISDEDDTARVPAITRMPEGVTVPAERSGRAVGQWILQVRCQCGRRWFELEAVDTATCPRCGVLVYVDVLAQRK